MRSQSKQQAGSPLAVLCLAIAFACVHSLLASRQAKSAAERLLGDRNRNGWYRFFYIVQSMVATIWSIRVFQRLPDRPLYRVRPPWAWLLVGIQVAALGLLASAVKIVGLSRLTGLESAADWVRGKEPRREPEAQGPPLGSDGRVETRGPFRFIRHPDNLPIILVFWAFPRMTVNRLVLAILASLYAVLGSRHEDSRLRAAYGDAYEDYSRETPMLVPGVHVSKLKRRHGTAR